MTDTFSHHLTNTLDHLAILSESFLFNNIYFLLKGRGHAKKVFLILVSNGQLNGEIMKYAFFKFLFLNYTINKHLCGSRYRSLTSQVDLINTEEMGKAEFYASFVNSIVSILS